MDEFLWCLKWRYSFGCLHCVVVKCSNNITTLNRYIVQTSKRRPSSDDRNSLPYTLSTMLPKMSQNKLLVHLSPESPHSHPSKIMHRTFLATISQSATTDTYNQSICNNIHLQSVNLQQHTPTISQSATTDSYNQSICKQHTPTISQSATTYTYKQSICNNIHLQSVNLQQQTPTISQSATTYTYNQSICNNIHLQSVNLQQRTPTISQSATTYNYNQSICNNIHLQSVNLQQQTPTTSRVWIKFTPLWAIIPANFTMKHSYNKSQQDALFLKFIW
jgi:hypothetical protein